MVRELKFGKNDKRVHKRVFAESSRAFHGTGGLLKVQSGVIVSL